MLTALPEQQSLLISTIREDATEEILAASAAVLQATIDELVKAKRSLGRADAKPTAALITNAEGLAETVLDCLASDLPIKPAEVVSNLDVNDELVEFEFVVDEVRQSVCDTLRQVAKAA